MQQIPPALQNLRDQIHSVHRTFLEALKYRFERTQGHPVNATQWFMTLTQNPDYAWFRPLTQLVTEFDILLDDKAVTSEMILAIASKTQQLFSPATPESENQFAARFFEMMPQELDMMMLYPNFRDAIKSLLAHASS